MSRRLPPTGAERGRGWRSRGGGPPRHPEPGEAMREAFRAAGLNAERPRTPAAGASTQPATTGPSSANGGSRSSSRRQPSSAPGPAKDKQARHPVQGRVPGKGKSSERKNGGHPASKNRSAEWPKLAGRQQPGAPVPPHGKILLKPVRPKASSPCPAPQAVNAKPQSPKPPTRAERWERFEHRLAGLAAVSEARARTNAAESGVPSTGDVELLLARLRAGVSTQDVGADSRRGRAVEIVLGVDFGTTSTKIVARLPYEAGAPAFAVPALPFARAEVHAYLWASRLWLAPDGAFSLRPLPRAALVCAIKTNLMAFGADDRVVLDAGGGLTATAEEAATAFLALQIRQAKGWLATEKAALLRKGPPRWSYNLGFPAASLNNAVLCARYERCAAAAVALAAEPFEVTLPVVRSALAAAATDAPRWLTRQRVALHPEIAAAVAGFANSIRREDGLYTLVDVGGGTVDCCTFNLFTAEHGSSRCPIFSARVELLGVEPWRLCEGNAAADEFRYLLDTLQTTVIWDTKRRRHPLSERWRTGLPLFFVGGGVSSRTHQASTAKLDAWLRRVTSAEAGVRVEPLPAPENLEHPECPAVQVHRLGVAIGLSMPAVDIPEVNLPDEIEDAEPTAKVRSDDRYVGKDQV